MIYLPLGGLPTSQQLAHIATAVQTGREVTLCIEDNASADHYLAALRRVCAFTTRTRVTLHDGVLVKIGPPTH